MSFWKKTKRAGKKFLKTTDKVAKFAKSAGHTATDVGGAVSAFGTVTAQPEIVAAGAALAGAGALTSSGAKAYGSIRKGDVKGAVHHGSDAHHHHSQHFA